MMVREQPEHGGTRESGDDLYIMIFNVTKTKFQNVKLQMELLW